MKPVTDNEMRNVKARIAFGITQTPGLLKCERIAAVKGLIRCDEDEARALISRGRRLAREKAKERAA